MLLFFLIEMRLLLALIFKICMNFLIVLISGLGTSIRSDSLIHARVWTHVDVRNMYLSEPVFSELRDIFVLQVRKVESWRKMETEFETKEPNIYLPVAWILHGWSKVG